MGCDYMNEIVLEKIITLIFVFLICSMPFAFLLGILVAELDYRKTMGKFPFKNSRRKSNDKI